jgi:hypothetical protein
MQEYKCWLGAAEYCPYRFSHLVAIALGLIARPEDYREVKEVKQLAQNGGDCGMCMWGVGKPTAFLPQTAAGAQSAPVPGGGPPPVDAGDVMGRG